MTIANDEMNWSPQQLEAIEKVRAWLADPEAPQIFHLFGFAGTGKTTLATTLAREVEGEVNFAAYTGKAASVMKRKGCWGATTIHSLIYKPLDEGAARLNELKLELMSLQSSHSHPDAIRSKELEIEDEEFRLNKPKFLRNDESNFRYSKLAIIDECSMVDEDLAADLLSFGVKILALGDPAQLPPVAGGGYFTECPHPEVMLTEIHRQALDNPILYLATRVREQQGLIAGSWGDNNEAVLKVRATDEDLLAADQILAGTNRTRKGINRRVRDLLGRCDPLPQVGDKIVCLRNNKEKGFLNGTLHEVVEVTKEVARKNDILNMVVKDEDGIERTTKCWQNHFLDGTIPPYEMRRWFDEFDYGYCLTVHKSQGSQWDNVLLVDEHGAFKEEGWRWRYTGITRAAKTLVMVKG